MLITICVLASIGALALCWSALNIHRLLHICQPNEVLVFSGNVHPSSQGKSGYRLIHGGRALRIPLLENVHKLDLTNMIVGVHVKSAYAKGGIPLNVDAVANLKIASTEPLIHNAIARFLDKSREDIMVVARQTLEGNLRGVLATLTPEELNADRIKFAQSLLHEADHDLSRLGLSLDNLKIQNISDDKGYLDCIGRKESARLQMSARMAEAQNRALSAKRASENLKQKEIAKLTTQSEIAQADSKRRMIEAQTNKEALCAQEKAAVETLVAKTSAQLDVQTARIEQMRLQLEAEQVKTALAEADKLIADSEGKAAQIRAQGEAFAQALETMAKVWKSCGKDAKHMMMAQKLDVLVPLLTDAVGKVHVQKMTVFAPELVNSQAVAPKAVVALEQAGQALGIDVAGKLGDLFKR